MTQAAEPYRWPAMTKWSCGDCPIRDTRPAASPQSPPGAITPATEGFVVRRHKESDRRGLGRVPAPGVYGHNFIRAAPKPAPREHFGIIQKEKTAGVC